MLYLNNYPNRDILKHYKGPYYAFLALFLIIYGYLSVTTWMSGHVISIILNTVFGLIFLGVLFLMLRFIFASIDNERKRDQFHSENFDTINALLKDVNVSGWNRSINKEVSICHAIANEVFESATCSLDAGIDFEDSGMKFMSGNKRITGYKSFGLFTPQLNNVALNLSNIEFYEHSGDKKRKVEAVIAVMTFRKSFQGRYYLMPDVFEMGGGNFLSKKMQKLAASAVEKISGYREIRLENPDFEEHYMLFGKDDIESRYLLSTNLMERLAVMAKRIGITPHVSFENDKMYIRLDKVQKFRMNETSTKHHFSQIHSFYEEVNSIAELVSATKGIWKD